MPFYVEQHDSYCFPFTLLFITLESELLSFSSTPTNFVYFTGNISTIGTLACFGNRPTLWQKSIALSSSVHLHFQHHQCCRHGCQEQRQYLIHTLKINFDLPRSRILNFPISDTLHCFCCPHWSADDSPDKENKLLLVKTLLHLCECFHHLRCTSSRILKNFTFLERRHIIESFWGLIVAPDY